MIRAATKPVLACAALAAALFLAAPVSAAEWSDNSISYAWGWAFREPGVVKSDGTAKEINKSIFSFTHVSGYKYGSNFLNADLLYSTVADPAVGSETAGGDGAGATELYLTYRHTLSFNKISGSKTFAFGPIADLGLTAGADLGTKNTSFGANKILPVIGPNIAIAVPGFWDINLFAVREWDNNGIVGHHVVFDPTFMVATSWGIPIGQLLSFEGYGDVELPKGKDGFGNQTKTEVLIHAKLMADVGSFWGWKKTLLMGVGYEYWLNKFGNDHKTEKGSEASTPFVTATWHL